MYYDGKGEMFEWLTQSIAGIVYPDERTDGEKEFNTFHFWENEIAICDSGSGWVESNAYRQHNNSIQIGSHPI